MNREHNKPGNTLWQAKPWQDDITDGFDMPDETVRSAIFNAARSSTRDNRLRTRVIPVARRLHTGIGGYLAWAGTVVVLLAVCYWFGRSEPELELQPPALVQQHDDYIPAMSTASKTGVSSQEYPTVTELDDRIFELKQSLIKEKIALYNDRAYGIYACNGTNRE